MTTRWCMKQPYAPQWEVTSTTAEGNLRRTENLSTSVEELVCLNGNSDAFFFAVDKPCSNSACLRSPCKSSLQESGAMGHSAPAEPDTRFLQFRGWVKLGLWPPGQEWQGGLPDPVTTSDCSICYHILAARSSWIDMRLQGVFFQGLAEKLKDELATHDESGVY